MGCGASSAAAGDPPVKTAAAAATAAPPAGFKPTTEADLEARGFAEKTGYLGMGATFYAMPSETDAEKKIAVAALADDAHGPVNHDDMDAAFLNAKKVFAELDKDRSGALELAELESLCIWLFEQFSRQFESDDAKRVAIKKQLARFQKNGPPTGAWTFRQFEEYYRRTIEEAEAYQLAQNEAYAEGYDKSAAAAKFAELDTGAIFQCFSSDFRLFFFD